MASRSTPVIVCFRAEWPISFIIDLQDSYRTSWKSPMFPTDLWRDISWFQLKMLTKQNTPIFLKTAQASPSNSLFRFYQGTFVSMLRKEVFRLLPVVTLNYKIHLYICHRIIIASSWRVVSAPDCGRSAKKHVPSNSWMPCIQAERSCK